MISNVSYNQTPLKQNKKLPSTTYNKFKSLFGSRFFGYKVTIFLQVIVSKSGYEKLTLLVLLLLHIFDHYIASKYQFSTKNELKTNFMFSMELI
jgi:hypothetical protein